MVNLGFILILLATLCCTISAYGKPSPGDINGDSGNCYSGLGQQCKNRTDTSYVTSGHIPPLQIAFGVMIYQKPGRSMASVLFDFHNLMEVIYTAHNHLYVLHVDVKSDPALIGSINVDFCSTKPNCIAIMSRNVAWAGLSTGEMMLALMQTAHEAGGTGNSFAYGDRYREFDPLYRHIQDHPIPGHNWSYFVLIGHESVPLVSLRYIESYLASYPAHTNFMNCMPVGGYNFFGQWEDASSRLSELHVDSFGGELVDISRVSEEAMEEVNRRWQHEATDKCGDNLDEVSDYSPPVLTQRGQPFHRQPPQDIEFYKSIQLMVVSREFVRYACYSLVARRIVMFLTNIKTSDEMFLPTILQSSEYFQTTVTCDTTLHFTHWIRPGGSWHPEYLTLEHLPVLLYTHTSHLFVRKLDSNLESSRQVAAVLHRIREEHLSVFDADSSSTSSSSSSSGSAGAGADSRRLSLLERWTWQDSHRTPSAAATNTDSDSVSDAVTVLPPHDWLIAVTVQYICESVVLPVDGSEGEGGGGGEQIDRNNDNMAQETVLLELQLSYRNSSRVPIYMIARKTPPGHLTNPSDLTPLSSTTEVDWVAYCRTVYVQQQPKISYDWTDKSYMHKLTKYKYTLTQGRTDSDQQQEYNIAPFDGTAVTITDTLTALHIIRMARDGIEIERQNQYWRNRWAWEQQERDKQEQRTRNKVNKNKGRA